MVIMSQYYYYFYCVFLSNKYRLVEHKILLSKTFKKSDPTLMNQCIHVLQFISVVTIYYGVI